MSLVFDNVSRTEKNDVHIHPTDLELAPGSFNTLLGRTGAGKTTLLRLMAGLDRPTGGRIVMDGVDVTRTSVRHRNVAMVYQQFINYPNFTVFENVASPLRVAGLERTEIDRKVREVAEVLHLENLLDRMPSEISGGQQQRTALARALVKDADLLLLDEPLVNLDYKLREELRVEFRNIFESRRSIIVYATAEPQEALALGGNTLIVDEGRILQRGPVASVYQRPANIRVAGVIGDPPMNVVAGRLDGDTIQMGTEDSVAKPEHLGDLPTGSYLFGVRPNHLLMARRSESDIEVEGCVRLAEISGSETSIHFEHNGESWVSRQDGVRPLDVGATISVFIEPHRIFAFDNEGTLVAAIGDRAPGQMS